MGGNIVTTISLRKEYHEVVAVKDVDLVIPAGEIFGLIGPNGAGKTTILRMLATALEPTSGQICFRGVDIWKRPREIREQIGFMPDFFQMYDRLKVGELLSYFGIAHGLRGPELRERVAEVLALTDLDEKRSSFVKGLSRGMMQRLGVGRAILHRPSLLLLDEPASGLDPLARRNLFDLLEGIHADGTAIVISSHILGELSDLCTIIGIMDQGSFLETGPTAEIIRKIMPKRLMAMQIVTGTDSAVKLLAGRPEVSQIEAGAERVRFAFDGDDRALAELNAALVSAGVGVALLEQAKTTLHEVYFAIAEGRHGAGSS